MRVDRVRIWAILTIGLGLGAGVFPHVVQAEATRMTNPTAIYSEFGGRALGYGIGFDRVVSNDISAGVGVGSTPLVFGDGSSAGETATLFPAYINYYLNDDQGSLFLTAGMTFVTG